MTIAVMVAIFSVVAICGAVSTRYLGDNNPVEEAAEEIVEEGIEHELHLPDGSLHGKIDLNTHRTHNT